MIILGGGLAGLAAAACLGDADFEVEIIEKRSVLGGRASSFVPPGESERIDNCQHVLLGCCTNLLDFFRRTDQLDQFRFYSSFLFVGPRGTSKMSASALPAPLHLLPSLLRFRDLGWKDRWAIGRAMRAILRLDSAAPDETMMGWLQRARQTSTAIENFWRVVLTSALNEDLERLSTRHAFKVFRDGFLLNRRGYRMGVPAVPLSELYSSKIISRKCSVRLGTMAAGLEIVDDRVRSVCLRDGDSRTADYVISTLPPDALCNLLPAAAAGRWTAMRQWSSPEWSPIAGIHLWFDRPITSLEHATIIGRTIQWVFNRSAVARRPRAGPQYIQLVISASRGLMNMRRDDLLDLCMRELRELFPQSKQANLLNAVVVKESKATLSPRPGIDAIRPSASTPWQNLFIAGDWTATGWPFTMEGAVRSGYRAAELVTEAAGNGQKFLLRDLPVAPLARFLQRM